MKQQKLIKLLAAGAVSAVALTTALAQESAITTSTVTGTGTVTTYTPGSDYISVRTEASSDPVRYYYTKDTTIVDPEGKTIEWSMLRPDTPVKYTYVKEGDRMVIRKITVTKPAIVEKTTTTTTTTKP